MLQVICRSWSPPVSSTSASSMQRIWMCLSNLLTLKLPRLLGVAMTRWELAFRVSLLPLWERELPNLVMPGTGKHLQSAEIKYFMQSCPRLSFKDLLYTWCARWGVGTSTRDDGTGMGMGFSFSTTECLVSSWRMGRRKPMWKCTKTKAQIAVEKLYSSTRAKYTEANNRSVVTWS